MSKQTINRKVFSFFGELSDNNNRDWFEKNKLRFKKLEVEVKEFLLEVNHKLNDHDHIEKAKMFRIYRDVRFSKNKTPYKTHFGMAFHRQKPSLRGGYYIHLEPNNSFLGVGFWGPNPSDLFRIRKELEVDAFEFRKIINEKSLKEKWGYLLGDEVKTSPKGFNKDHLNIDLIRKKQYIFSKKVTDEEVISFEFLSLIENHFKSIRPFFDYMSSLLSTDLNGESIF
tara:strand:+ start:73 stop:750 length:678 start_codon:yes stop_codon:yes gene_type:complete